MQTRFVHRTFFVHRLSLYPIKWAIGQPHPIADLPISNEMQVKSAEANYYQASISST